MEGENDSDVIIVDDQENQRNNFKTYFKETYDYEIKDKHIIGIHPVTEVFDVHGAKYQIEIKEAAGK
jgi:hypothetical protein